MKHIITVALALLLPFAASAQDWSKPNLSSTKTDFMTEAHDLWNQCAKQDFTTGSNIPIGSIRYNRDSDLWQEWNGTTWSTAPISATALGSGGITSSMIQDGTITSADLGTDSVGADEIAAGAVGTSEIADGTVTSTDILNGTIVGADLANGTITGTQVLGESLGGDKIQDGTIGAADLGTDSVGADEISAGAVGTSEVSDNSLTANDLAADSVGSSELADNAVDTNAIANNAVTGGKIADGTIGSDDIQNASVTGTDIAVGTIVESNIWDGNITNAKIADGAVTHAKLSGTWSSVTVSSTTLFDCGASCGNGTGETGTYKYIQFGPMKYFYLDITYTFAGTSVDELGLELPIAAANSNFTFFCTVGANNGEAVVGISNSGSTTQARLVKTSGNFGEGSGRNLKCSGFYE